MATKGSKMSEETKKKISAAITGIKRSQETKDKISKNKKGTISWNKGKINVLSLSAIKKMSEAKKGHIPWNKGQPFSKESRIKMSLAKKGKTGEKCCNWKGGITPIMVKIRTSLQYVYWRQQVFIRDNFTCQDCGQKGGNLEAHHIKRFSILIKEAKELLPLFDLYNAAMLYIPL